MGKVFALKVPEINSLTSSPPKEKLLWISVFPIVFFFLIGWGGCWDAPSGILLSKAIWFFPELKQLTGTDLVILKAYFDEKLISIWSPQCRFCIQFYCITPYWVYFNSDLPFSKYHKTNPLIPPQIIFGILNPHDI